MRKVAVMTIMLAAAMTATAATNVTLNPGDCVNVCSVNAGSGGGTQPPGGGNGGGSGSGGWNGTCPGFNKTLRMTLNWQNPQRLYTQNFGGFRPGDVMVVEFTTGAISSAGSLPRVAAAEYNSSPSNRTATLSLTPCDFGPQSTMGASALGNSITMVFAVGSGSGWNYYPIVPTNTTAYVNIKNTDGATCEQNSVCDMFVDLVKTF